MHRFPPRTSRSSLFLRVLLACTILLVSLQNLYAGAAPAHPANVSVDISSLVSFLDTLPPDEKDEQVRDWAAYGLKNELGLSTGEEVPIRHPSLKETAPGEVSKGRVFALSDKEWAVLLPRERRGDKPLIGALIDKRYAKSNALPEKISLFTYALPEGASSVDISFERSFDSAAVFSAEYGYSTASVSSLPELRKFLKNADDVVMVQWSPGALLIGARSYGHDARRAVSAEEIAALYQAYNTPGSPSKIGFSLDLDMDYDAFADDMEEFVRTSPLVRNPGFVGASASDLGTVAHRVRITRSDAPLVALLRALSASGSDADMRVFSAIYSIQQYRTYQKARYDGSLQGTQAGMTLFYTDLLAKMWAMDYEGSSPKLAIKGFRPMTEIMIPKLYWQGYGRAANTRLWFGLKQDAFEVYRDKTLFQPIATRVYAASSNMLTPGKEETAPNYQSGEFLGWWDRHYEALADYEPAYHRLNQIQKWSCIILMLKVSGLKQLDFLLDLPVRRDIDFEQWSRGSERLQGAVSLPFLDKQKLGRRTECLSLLQSKPHPFLGGYGMISGGITLATQADILAKMKVNGAAPSAAIPVLTGLPFPVGGAWQKGAMTTGGAPAPTAESVPQKGKPAAEPQPAQSAQPAVGGVSAVPLEDKEIGAGKGKKQALRLAWEKSPALEAVSLVTALANAQRPSASAGKGEALFKAIPSIQSVVRVKDWETYLVKLATVKEMWIYLSINPAQVDDYPAKAAGSFKEADIFCAKVISAAEAEKLAQGKPVLGK